MHSRTYSCSFVCSFCICSRERSPRRFSGSPKMSFSACSKSVGIQSKPAIVMHIENFADFWPYYVRQHASPGTRTLHAIGSVLATVTHGGGPAAHRCLLRA